MEDLIRECVSIFARDKIISRLFMDKYLEYINDMLRCDKEHRNDRLKLAIS